MIANTQDDTIAAMVAGAGLDDRDQDPVALREALGIRARGWSDPEPRIQWIRYSDG